MADAGRPTDAAPPESLLAGLRGWLHDGVELLRVRLALVALEAREHAHGVVALLLLGLAAVLLLVLGLGFLAVLLTVLLWDSHRVLALALFSAVFLTLGGVALAGLARTWARQRVWFEASTAELAQDAERLRP
ncbi:phage holin family protein [Aquabacterium sp. A08]|uniref:phage holin family protein n=1 Tax=Aquabacterium sp. A08 TaxID=2718532 RepID=UPI00141F0CBF|nr:phage holin family protein [Aquabacterium sp. A08]NIC40248.1 hypothetical protein [Aquabacterium sp. A08]